MAAAKQNSLLVSILNKGLAQARQSGVLDKISTKWLGMGLAPKESWIARHIWWVGSASGGIL